MYSRNLLIQSDRLDIKNFDRLRHRDGGGLFGRAKKDEPTAEGGEVGLEYERLERFRIHPRCRRRELDLPDRLRLGHEPEQFALRRLRPEGFRLFALEGDGGFHDTVDGRDVRRIFERLALLELQLFEQLRFANESDDALRPRGVASTGGGTVAL